MGAFFGNIAAKATDKVSLVQAVGREGEPFYVAGPVEEWTLIFPENDFEMSNIAQRCSEKLETIATVGQVFDSDDFIFQVFDKGKLVFDFIEDKTSGAGIAIKEGNVSLLKKYAPKPLNTSELENVLNKQYVFAEEKYHDVVSLLGLPEALSNYWGFAYIENGDMEEEAETELPNLTRHPDDTSNS